MQTIEVTIHVLPEGRIELEGLPELPPGKHPALLLVDPPSHEPKTSTPSTPLQLKMLDWSAWPAGTTFRREDLYGDDQR